MPRDRVTWLATTLLLVGLAGCRNEPRNPTLLTPVATAIPTAPATSTVPPSPTPVPSPTPRVVIHVVQQGETLLAIAEQYGVTVPEIVELNGLTNPDALQIGQELKIPQP
ncbi:MAG: LysM peptidoglycan-binding domain-containing protein [Ardenticatenaceae bacterium]|nr:LysM peptidoglycan-binding domain-containing protein [Ardenticatenaceae bacterium]